MKNRGCPILRPTQHTQNVMRIGRLVSEEFSYEQPWHELVEFYILESFVIFSFLKIHPNTKSLQIFHLNFLLLGIIIVPDTNKANSMSENL